MQAAWQIPGVLLLALSFLAAASALERPIDVEKSSIRIHVGKAGLFSAAAHEHWVAAPIAHGSIDDSEAAAKVVFAFDARKLAVEPDKDLSADKRAEVQRTMHQKVLESERYPEIAFRSTFVEKTGNDEWSVRGTLTLHGQSLPVTAAVRRTQDKYVGRCRFKQTDFGIQPVTVGGGLVKVKDELNIEFAVVAMRPTDR